MFWCSLSDLMTEIVAKPIFHLNGPVATIRWQQEAALLGIALPSSVLQL